MKKCSEEADTICASEHFETKMSFVA